MTGPVLSLSNVSLFIEGRGVLHDITWKVMNGENWVVVGPNGAGKTTLLKLLNGYHWPSSGKVTILGERLGRVDLRELRRRMGLISPFVSDSIPEEERALDVVLSGKYASIGLWDAYSVSDRRYAMSLLRRTGCERHQNSKFGSLSQGEKQKVVIARALMAKPHLLLLDEPCAGLDIRGREKFLSALGRLALGRNPGVIYVTHRIEEIPIGFTHAMLLKRGRVVGKGKIHDVLNDEHLSKCFGIRIEVKKRGDRYYASVDG